MTQLKFYKYHGAGNDFIIVDFRSERMELSQQAIASICDRHKGVGADGFMILDNDPHTQFLMRYFNADGSESTMCGNGGRAIALFAHHMGIGGVHKVFTGIDAVHEVDIIETDDTGGGVLKLGMKDVDEVSVNGGHYFLDTGSPHYVEFVDNISQADVFSWGHKIRYSDEFASAGGVNVNFAEVIADGHIKVRTYERGVENETLACGTGVTASVLAAVYRTGSNIENWCVDVEGGTLFVSFKRVGDVLFRNIILTGEAQKVFEGEVDINFCMQSDGISKKIFKIAKQSN